MHALKAKIAEAIERSRDALFALGEDLFDHAELGFREERTSSRVAGELRRLGLEPEEGLALTGVKARGHGRRSGPTVCVMGELDGLPVPDHPRADPVTGAVHACGHNAQLVHLVAVARALVEAGALDELAGDVVFFGVPAEEYVDLDWRAEQARDGRIGFLGGKPELLRLGAFDDVDLAMMVHATGEAEDRSLSMRLTGNGLVAKRARFIGRASHAAASPERGVNALNAATLALQAIHMQRETFRDDDHIRVHPILTRAGAAVNVVPADVRLETYVRGASTRAIRDAEVKVDRALRAGAMAVGASVEIETLPGYLPLSIDTQLAQVFKENALSVVGPDGWAELGPFAASTDAGDLSYVMPVLHPSHGGCAGRNHAADFSIADFEVAYIKPAVALAWTIVDLMSDNAARARQILSDFTARLSRDEYVAHMRALARTETWPGPPGTA